MCKSAFGTLSLPHRKAIVTPDAHLSAMALGYMHFNLFTEKGSPASGINLANGTPEKGKDGFGTLQMSGRKAVDTLETQWGAVIHGITASFGKHSYVKVI